jgi:hypothetical protein
MKLRNKTLMAGLTGLLATGLTAGWVTASPGEVDDDAYQRRGPLPFQAFDQNDDGSLSSDEFYDVHAARMKYRAEHGFPMRNAAQAPSFEQIDVDGNGSISPDELSKYQSERMQQRWAARATNRPNCKR